MSSDIVYYNATVLCNKIDPSSNDYQAIFEDNVQTPLVSNTSTYKFAIARYSMIGHRLPIWIPKIRTSPNQTSYSMKMNIVFNTKSYTSDEIFLNYIPRNSLTSVDPEYYYSYSYEQFIEMINASFAACITNLQSKIIGYTITTNPPFMVYDSTSNLFTIYFDERGNGTPERITCSFNNELYNLLNSFYFERQPLNWWNLIVVDKITNRFTDPTTSVNYIICTQSYGTTALWSPVQSIIFSSESLQVNPEVIGSVSVVGDGSSLGSNQSNNSQQMITDIVLDLDQSSDFNGMITYIPSEYRYISMLDSREPRSVKFSVWWLNKFNQVRYPIKLSNGGLITMKMMFQRIY